MNVILSGTAWSVGGELSINPVFNWIWLLWLVPLLFYAALFTLIVLGIRALLKYLRAGKGDPAVRRSLGEALKAHRMKSNMTQEFVAESLGVSRQAVWDNIRRAEAALRDIEDKVGLVSRFRQQRQALNEAAAELSALLASPDGTVRETARAVMDRLQRIEF